MASNPFSACRFSVVLLLFLLVNQLSIAQYGRRRSAPTNSWEIGISGGVSAFVTSINPNSDALYKKFNYWNVDYNPSLSLSLIKNINSKFATEFEYLTTKISGKWNINNGYPVPQMVLDKGLDYPDPFKTGVNQFNLLAIININEIVLPNISNKQWELFVKGGLGTAFLKEYEALYPYVKPGRGFQWALLYGAGFSYKIDERIKIKAGATWSTLNTDRLDGIHTLKPGGSYRINEGYYYNVRERFMTASLGMTYRLGQNNRHFFGSSRSIWFKPAKQRYKRR